MLVFAKIFFDVVTQLTKSFNKSLDKFYNVKYFEFTLLFCFSNRKNQCLLAKICFKSLPNVLGSIFYTNSEYVHKISELKCDKIIAAVE